MDDSKKKFFFIIHPKYYALHIIHDDNEILYEKKLFHDGLDFENKFINLKKFLDDNIFKIEKKFSLYVNDIYLIIDDKDLINIDVSLIKDFEYLSSDFKYIQSDLQNIKDSVLKSNFDFELVHMVISKFIIDQNEYFELPKDINQKNLFLEIRLICLKKEVLSNFKKILSNYEISIQKILNYKYIDSFKTDQMVNTSLIASKLINGLNKNEINFIKRRPKNAGFFEKFFKFFS